jgi:uncharacterized membrane protein YgcG
MKFWLAILCLAVSASAVADERILSFHSDVRIMTDGMIEVTETIQVRAEGQHIRRGIYRDFPVEYRDTLGNTHLITVEPLVVLRNDSPKPFHTVRNRRDVRTYFGSSDRFIEPGVHTYTYRYRANRLLGFFDEHDELYWNVTGNRWVFPIDKASATVRFDFDVPRNEVLVEAYTGRFGSKEQAYSRYMDEAGAVHFAADNALPPAHGLTIVVGWPKGFVAEPTDFQKVRWLLSDNANLVVIVIGYLLLFAYYIPIWLKHGKDPDAGVIVTRYVPPEGYSPASLRFIRQMYYDNKTMTAGVVSLAVKRYLKIKNKDGTHSLEKVESSARRPALSTGEKELYDALFKTRAVTLQNANHAILGAAQSAHKKSLKKDYNKKYFRTNGLFNIPAAVIVLLTTIISLNVGFAPSKMSILLLIPLYIIMSFFAFIMKRPTLRGRKVLDEMLGFKDYLEVAEKDELNLRNPPEKTPELFEAYLPFALALGVDQEWAERFDSVLASVRGADGKAYSPTWYDGHWNSANLSKATTGLSSGLNSALGSSVSPPGSSSGGGGGGSSGGGGGGGGGGGW